MSENRLVNLTLEDGSKFVGKHFGALRPVSGEIVFNTSMTGYPESLTDPSYSGQILVMTFPLIGNYGVPPMDMQDGLLKYFESDKIHIKGLVVADYSFEHSHWNAVESLDQWLKDNDVPAVYGVDTRQITKIIRERGTMLCKLTPEGCEEVPEFVDQNSVNLVAEVSTKDIKKYGSGKNNIILVDYGAKNNIIRCLTERGATVTVVPWNYDFTEMDYDGVMLSNGPGDPSKCGESVRIVRRAMEVGKPIFGICMGNQILAQAAGAETYKLKYGHRSHNQPALMVGSQRAYITSQNHGFAVDTAKLGDEWETYFTNLNDDTCEGIRHRTKPFYSVQFHPEASSGPVDTEFLFDKFIQDVEDAKNR